MLKNEKQRNLVGDCGFLFVSGMQGNNAATEIFVVHRFESDLFQGRGKGLLVWEFPNRIGEILINAGLIPGHPGPDLRQEGKGIKVVEPAPYRGFWSGKFKQGDPPTRFEDAPHFLQGLRKVDDVSDAKAAHDGIKRRFSAGEALRVALSREGLMMSLSCQLLFANFQHRMV